MERLLYNAFFGLQRKKKKYLNLNKKYPSLFQKSINYIEWYFNIFLKKYYMKRKKQRSGITKQIRDPKIIISLTSYPKRIGTIWMTIETLLRQEIKADEIILWLAKEQFDGIESLPQNLINLQDRGLTIRFCDDLRSHKKYFYVMQEYPDDIVILVDDDMFYPEDTVKKLLELHEKYPKDVCCMTGQVMTGEETLPSQWRNPNLDEKLEHRSDVQIFTGSGSLYPPRCLHSDTFNFKLIAELCPYADDLWLTYMAHINNTKVTAYYPWRAFPITIYGTAVNSLWYINAEQGKNDKQWTAIKKYYENGIEDSDK